MAASLDLFRGLDRDLDASARESFGLLALKAWQREAVTALLAGKNVLVVAPTGGGKSLTYQLPAVLLHGTTLVLSPLISLMADQVHALEARGIPATYIASTLDLPELRKREQGMRDGKYRLVYVAPERLRKDSFVDMLRQSSLALVAIDEAHCISQWGHDFRPDYLRIGEVLRTLRPARVLACTATATPEVRREIIDALGLAPCQEILRGFARPNLHLFAEMVETKDQKERFALRMLARRGAGAAIVYTATRKGTDEWAAILRGVAPRIATYHAGQDAKTRTRTSAQFANRTLDVVVATNAFGMGIDRPDIRTVVHVQPPGSIEAYYQEVGRAGRDGEPAFGLMLCSSNDIALRRRIIEDSAEGERNTWDAFRQVLRYLDARSCRHDFILRYFDDEHEVLGGCGHCDICTTIDAVPPASAEATTLIVRKALAGVARARGRAGITNIAAMLLGKSTKKLSRMRLDKLSTYGILRERDETFVLALLRSLLAAGWIELTAGDYPMARVTKVGWDVMTEKRPALITLPVRRKPK